MKKHYIAPSLENYRFEFSAPLCLSVGGVADPAETVLGKGYNGTQLWGNTWLLVDDED